jgi:DNA-binding LytR/AlgR family response regulator
MFSGDKLSYGPFELTRAYLHRYMLIYYVLLCFFLTIVDTRSGSVDMLIEERARNLAISVALGVLLLILIALVLEYIGYRWGTVRITGSPFLLLAAAIGVLADTVIFSDSISPWPYTVAMTIYYYIVVEAFAHLLGLIVTPRVLADLRARKAKGNGKAKLEAKEPAGQRLPAQAGDHVEIGGRRIEPESLVQIIAEGNYLRVVTQEERLYLPGPFGAAVDPLPESLGVQVSRSDWVAAKAAAAIRREGREMYVVLKDGSAVRVANSRQKVVTSVLDVPVQKGVAG